MKPLRLFLAIDLSDVEKQALHCVAYELHSQFKDGRIHPEERYHVTLHFFEEAPEGRLKDIRRAMHRAAEGVKPFTIVTGGPGIFGNPENAVVWIGLSEGNEELDALHWKLEGLLTREGFLEDARPFRPHITLGREIDTTAWPTPMAEVALPSMNLQANALTLLESKIVDGRPVYEPLCSVEFVG